VKVPPLGRAKAGPPPPSPAHGQTAQQQQPYSVQQLAFSPALDVSVLRQVRFCAWRRFFSLNYQVIA
jgi:hypothetical protein